jgi:acyl-CoA hydrolase/GNAT superfamily N-acetyltransferase
MDTVLSQDWQSRYAGQVESANEAVRRVRHGSRVFIGSGAGEPQSLVRALAARENLDDAEIVHIMTLGVAPYAEPAFDHRFRHNAFFIGANTREAVNSGRADYTPVFLSEIPRLFRDGRIVIDVALIQVSPPDEHGYCSFGVSTDIVKSAAESAKVVIAEVNSQAPRALGDCFIHVRNIDALVACDDPILEAPQAAHSDLAAAIGRHVASLVQDGATLQLGIGQIPDAVLGHLADRHDLGIHTEMFSDGVLPLIDAGVLTNARKTLHRGKMVASFVMGSRALYDFVDNNPMVEFHPTEYVNDPFVIAQNERMVSINAALEVDLTGQVCADSLGPLFYSGVGGQVDFVRGASRSPGGKAVIALPSTADDGTVSRIVPTLKPGAGVVTSRGDVHYVVTEYGVAYLHGKTIRERATALIQIAHPRFQPWLLAEAKERHLVYADQVEPPFVTPVYPDWVEQPLTLDDGRRVFIRPIRLTDEPPLREMFYALSEETVYHRFFQVLPTMPHRKLQEWLRVDYERQMVIVVTSGLEGDEAIVAVARYDLDERTNLAEVAFVVRDDFQGHHLATHLLARLIEVARANGIAGFTASVLADNMAMLRVFHAAFPALESQLRDGTYELTMRIGPAASAVAGPSDRPAS